METEVILWILGSVNVVTISWSTWVTNQIFLLKQEMALNNRSDEEVKNFIKEVNTKLESISVHLQNIVLSLAKNGIDVEKK